jgi:hypothetical protein
MKTLRPAVTISNRPKPRRVSMPTPTRDKRRVLSSAGEAACKALCWLTSSGSCTAAIGDL